jgi:hypothetical protein
VVSDSNCAVILENASSAVSYGNSNFNLLTTSAYSAYPNAGLLVRSTNYTHAIDHCTFQNYYQYSGYYGICSGDAQFFDFQHIDIEDPVKLPIALGAKTSIVDDSLGTVGFTFLGGYVLTLPGDTSVYCSSKTAGNAFKNLTIENEDTAGFGIIDQSVAYYTLANSYDVNFAYPATPKVQIANTGATSLIYRLWTGRVVNSLVDQLSKKTDSLRQRIDALEKIIVLP